MEGFNRNTHTKELKEWSRVVNGVTFYCWLDARGLKHCTACHREEAVLEGAAKLMRMGGWEVTVKLGDKGFYALAGDETKPSEPGTIHVFDGEG